MQPMPTCSLSRSGLLAAGFTVCLIGAVLIASPRTGAQEDGPFEPFLDLVSSQYLSPEQAGGKQTIRLTLDISPDVPVGAKIQLLLMYNGLFLDDDVKVLELKSAKRDGVIFDFQPKTRLGVDKYMLSIRLPLELQTPKVKNAIEKKPKAFPPAYASSHWAWHFMNPKYAIEVGTEKELEAEREQICDFYYGAVGELIDNMNEFVDSMTKLRDGEKFRQGDKVDVSALKKFIKDWRKKQGEVQKKIRLFPLERKTLHTKTRQSHIYLDQLAMMVSKRAVQEQKAIAKEYELKPYEPRYDGKTKRDEVLNYFNAGWRYKVSAKALNDRMEKLDISLAPFCGEEEEETGDAAAGDGETGEEGAAETPKKKSKSKGRRTKKE